MDLSIIDETVYWLEGRFWVYSFFDYYSADNLAPFEIIPDWM